MATSEPALIAAFETLRRLARERPLFAILDAARDGDVPFLLERLRVPFRSLYHGPEGDSLASVAPYLAELTQSPDAARRLLQEGWGDSRGIFLSATGTLVALRRHLRRLLVAELGEDKERVLFRFYDPRVMRALFPVCTEYQRGILFGAAVECYVVEDEDGTPLEFRREQEGAPAGYHRKTVALQFTAEQAESVLLYGRGLVEFITRHLQETCPRLLQGIAPGGVQDFVALAVSRGRGHGLTRPADLSVFAVLMFEIAPNFDQHPSVRRRLAEALRPGSGGLAEALAGVEDHVWTECAERYDPNVWSEATDNRQGRNPVWTGQGVRAPSVAARPEPAARPPAAGG